MIVCLKIIFIGILSLFVFQNMSEEATFDHMTDAYVDNKKPEKDESRLSFIESSSDQDIQRTINNILKSRYADLSTVNILTTGNKDNNDVKHLLPETCRGIKKYTGRQDSGLSKLLLSKSHDFINSPKLYYIYTLERIII